MRELLTHLPFENKAHPPPMWVVMVLLGPVVVAVQETVSPIPEPAVDLWWIALGYVGFVVVMSLIIVPFSWARVRVDERGLHVRGRLVVRVEDMGEVGLVAWSDIKPGPMHELRGLRLPWRQNLYGGGFGWGKGVFVEHRPPGGEATIWLLPGPRARDMVAALEVVQSRRPGVHPTAQQSSPP